MQMKSAEKLKIFCSLLKMRLQISLFKQMSFDFEQYNYLASSSNNEFKEKSLTIKPKCSAN